MNRLPLGVIGAFLGIISTCSVLILGNPISTSVELTPQLYSDSTTAVIQTTDGRTLNSDLHETTATSALVSNSTAPPIVATDGPLINSSLSAPAPPLPDSTTDVITTISDSTLSSDLQQTTAASIQTFSAPTEILIQTTSTWTSSTSDLIQMVTPFAHPSSTSIETLVHSVSSSESQKATQPQLFTPSTIDLVRKSWAMLNTDIDQIGYGILMTIFAKYPEYLQKFEKFKDIPIDQLKNCKEFYKHAGRVAGGLQLIVKNVDQPDVLLSALRRLGRSHVFFGVLKENFQNAEPLILEYIFGSLKEHATLEVREAWTKVLHDGIEIIVKAQEGK